MLGAQLLAGSPIPATLPSASASDGKELKNFPIPQSLDRAPKPVLVLTRGVSQDQCFGAHLLAGSPIPATLPFASASNGKELEKIPIPNIPVWVLPAYAMVFAIPNLLIDQRSP